MSADEMREAQLQGHVTHCENEVAEKRRMLAWSEDRLVRAKDALQQWREHDGRSGLDEE